MAVTTFGILTTLTVYLYLKPDLPEISLVDQSQLQIPLKIYTSDGVLIGEFGEKNVDLLVLMIFQIILKMLF
jgi:penicillin-binding protein 1A